MTEPTQDSAAAYATALLIHYGFELRGYNAEELVALWLKNYQANWVRLAVIEALYQGRYKSISVEQILAVWKRRGRTLYHFNHEFERLICRKFPQNLTENTTPQAAPSETLQSPVLSTQHSDASRLQVSQSATQSSEASRLRASELATHSSEVSRLRVSELATQSSAEIYPSVSSVTPVPPPGSSSSLVESDITPVNVKKEQRTDIGNPPEAAEQSSPSHRVTYQADWSRWEVSKRPIDQFTPTPEVSDFYLKLKAVAQLHEDLTEEDAYTTEKLEKEKTQD